MTPLRQEGYLQVSVLAQMPHAAQTLSMQKCNEVLLGEHFQALILVRQHLHLTLVAMLMSEHSSRTSVYMPVCN